MTELFQEALHPRDEWGQFRRKNPKQAAQFEHAAEVGAKTVGTAAVIGAYPVAVRQGLFMYLRRSAPTISKFEMREGGYAGINPNFLPHFAFLHPNLIKKLEGNNAQETVANIYKHISHLDVEHGFVVSPEGKILSAQRGGSINVPIVGTLKDIHGWHGAIMVHNHPPGVGMKYGDNPLAHSHADMGLLFRHGLSESHVVTRSRDGKVHVFSARAKDPNKIPGRAYRTQAYMRITKTPKFRTTLANIEEERPWEQHLHQVDPLNKYIFEHHIAPGTGFGKVIPYGSPSV